MTLDNIRNLSNVIRTRYSEESVYKAIHAARDVFSHVCPKLKKILRSLESSGSVLPVRFRKSSERSPLTTPRRPDELPPKPLVTAVKKYIKERKQKRILYQLAAIDGHVACVWYTYRFSVTVAQLYPVSVNYSTNKIPFHIITVRHGSCLEVHAYVHARVRGNLTYMLQRPSNWVYW